MHATNGFSRHIDLGRLERETRELLFCGVVFGVFFHFGIALLIVTGGPPDRAVPSREERRIVTDLVPVPPRAGNPYDNWRGPPISRVPRRPLFQRVIPDIAGRIRFRQLPRFGEGAFRFRGGEYGIDTDALIMAVVRRGVLDVKNPIVDPPFPRLPVFEPYKPRRTDEYLPNRVSMRGEMLTAADFNTGKHKGLVVLNLADERSIKGYLYIPSAVRADSLRQPRAIRRSVSGLASVLKSYTGILGVTDSPADIISPDLLKYPFLVIAADMEFHLSPEELTNLGNHLRHGGFAFVEGYGTGGPGGAPPSAESLRRMILEALGPGGELRPIPQDHFLYRCFFAFEGGPPRNERDDLETAGQPPPILEGAWIGDRLAVVYSEKGYAAAWGDTKGSESFKKMGVNIAVFALIQTGGLTVKLVDDGR